MVGRTTKVRQAMGVGQEHAVERLKSRVNLASAENAATAEVMVSESLEDKFKALESHDKVELLLAEIKQRRALPQ
jgi:phage shock protein A